jgi:hypothetical protein
MGLPRNRGKYWNLERESVCARERERDTRSSLAMGRRERLKSGQDGRGEELLFSSHLPPPPLLSLVSLSLSTHFFGGRRTVLLCDFVRLCLQIKITPLIDR